MIKPIQLSSNNNNYKPSFKGVTNELAYALFDLAGDNLIVQKSINKIVRNAAATKWINVDIVKVDGPKIITHIVDTAGTNIMGTQNVIESIKDIVPVLSRQVKKSLKLSSSFKNSDDLTRETKIERLKKDTLEYTIPSKK